MNTLETSNSNNYNYQTKELEIHILGGLKLTKLESLRVTLSIQKLKQYDILRNLYNLKTGKNHGAGNRYNLNIK
jgi:hypothetical protein